MEKMQTIQSSDYASVIAESFDVLVDPKPRFPAKPVIGLKVDPYKGSGKRHHRADRVQAR